MRYGAYVPNFGPYGDVTVLADLASEAEEAGWDGFFLWDQVSKTTLTPGVDPMVDPWIALAAIALCTRTIRLGTLVTPLPRRRPWMVARQTVSLDHLSAGRLILGVGSGGGYFDFEALGEASDPTKLASLLDEGLAVLSGLWSGEPFRHHGTNYQIREAQFLPQPVQAPRIPIWVADVWPSKAPLRRAVRFDGIIPIGRDLPLTAMLTQTQMQEIIRYVASQPGYTAPFEVVHLGLTAGLDKAHDLEIILSYQQVGVTWWVEKILPERWGNWTDWPLEAMRARIRQGPPR
jgi:alkanesulfonate monooxygenase SsuD/methylene tetrahydromethanopterin reductase-like flavin-dependent oxidoreductase (luciferase family)